MAVLVTKDALIFYTKGIDQRPNDAPLLMAQLYNNRAAVQLAIKNYGYAVKDAALSISYDQSNESLLESFKKLPLAF